MKYVGKKRVNIQEAPVINIASLVQLYEETAGEYKSTTESSVVLFWYDQVCKPGSVLTAIYLALQLLIGSSRLLETIGQIYAFLHGVATG